MPASELIVDNVVTVSIEVHDRSANTGTLTVGHHKNWLYTKKLFAADGIDTVVRTLIAETMGRGTNFRVHLWAGLPGGLIPSVDIEARTEMHAAALGLKHFRSSGHDISATSAHVDVEAPGDIKITMPVPTVLRWLKASEQVKFVQHEGLQSLLYQSSGT